MTLLDKILKFIPEVRKPSEKKVSFNTKLKWTLILLVSFFVLANVPLYGADPGFMSNLEFIQVILASEFGSLITLGIGPIVMSSIVLQLLAGSGILNIDTKTNEGRKQFQGLQKIGIIFFIVFEAIVYVLMGGVQAADGFVSIVIFQLILGGLAIMFMDDTMQKWGFGSGVSIFIVAGVARTIFTRLFQFVGQSGNCLADFSNVECGGAVLVIIQSIVSGSASTNAMAAFAGIAVTAIIFLAVVWAQALKVEIPLVYERIRGYSMKWPLAFFYSSVMPVILVAALLANVQLFGGLIEGWLGYPTFLGHFENGQPISGLAYWLSAPNILQNIIRGSFQMTMLWRTLFNVLFYMTFAALFSVFWIRTSGMDESSQAQKILSSGLQLPGFRKDPRVLESVLRRYIMPLTIMGGLAIGALASVANVLGALTSGTSILLAVMIMYQLYENIAKQHAMDMHPSLRKMFT